MKETIAKSVLIIDTPKNCYECKLIGACRRITNHNPDFNLVDCRPDWCQLSVVFEPDAVISRNKFKRVLDHIRKWFKPICPRCFSNEAFGFYNTETGHLVYRCKKCNTLYH